jgi:hypothetical protein
MLHVLSVQTKLGLWPGITAVMLTKRSFEPELPPAYSGPQGELDLRTSVAESPAEEDARGARRLRFSILLKWLETSSAGVEHVMACRNFKSKNVP